MRVSGGTLFTSIIKQLQYNQGCYFLYASYAFLELSILRRMNIKHIILTAL